MGCGTSSPGPTPAVKVPSPVPQPPPDPATPIKDTPSSEAGSTRSQGPPQVSQPDTGGQATNAPSEQEPSGASPNVARLFVVGPPSSGKGALVSKLVKDLGVEHLRESWLVRFAKARNLPSAAKAEACEGGTPDAVLMEVLAELTTAITAEGKGFVVDGVPKSAAQAEALKERVPSARLVVVDISDDEIVRFHGNRVVDPATNQQYNLETSPPPEELVDSCVRQAMDEEEQVRARLAPFTEELPKITAVLGDKVFSVKGTTQAKSEAEAEMFSKVVSEFSLI